MIVEMVFWLMFWQFDDVGVCVFGCYIEDFGLLLCLGVCINEIVGWDLVEVFCFDDGLCLNMDLVVVLVGI